MFHEEPWNGKGVCTRWKIATHCSTKRSWVEQCVAIFHRVLTPCHCTALSETFVLYDTSNVNKSDFNPKSESLNIKVFPKWPERAEITLTVCVTSDRATTRMDVARYDRATSKLLNAASWAFNQSDCDNLGRSCTTEVVPCIKTNQGEQKMWSFIAGGLYRQVH